MALHHPEHWSQSFVGLPWLPGGRGRDGCDCWGLVCLVYREALQIELPSFDGAYVTARERRDIAAIVSSERDKMDWREVATPADFDVLLFRVGRYESHVGIACGRGMMLHASSGNLSAVERIGPMWASRLAAIYRHRMRA